MAEVIRNAAPSISDRPESLALEFERFAREEFHNSSPLYERLCLAISEDREILTLAASAREGERVPNLLFAAVHFLLLKGTKHPLSVFYPTVSGKVRLHEEDHYPKFRSFCLERSKTIRELISSGLVQTNEVRRCAFLMPAFVHVYREVETRPFYLVEIGASAGLNLLWDRYGYRYGEERSCGDPDSPVQIKSGMRGGRLPPVPEKLPEVSFRVGIDLNPIDVRDLEAALWLHAFVWPEHVERLELLKRAVQVAREDPPELVAGDAVDVLPSILARVPEGTPLCIFRVFTALRPEARDQLSALCAEYGAKRDLFLLTARPDGRDASLLQLVSLRKGVKAEKVLARCQNHGNWLEWLDASTNQSGS